jgi:surface protein
MFDEANVFNQDIGRWNVGKVTNMYWMFGGAAPINIPDISVTLPTSQSPISWLKVVARLNIQDILVTLLTSQSPMYWLKEG